jgi:hypothetical protein
MVGGAGVCNKKARAGMMGVGESLDKVSRRVVEESHDVFGKAMAVTPLGSIAMLAGHALHIVEGRVGEAS